MNNITLNQKIANYILKELHTPKSCIIMAKEILQIVEEKILTDLLKICHTIALEKGFWDSKICPECNGTNFIVTSKNNDGYEDGYACIKCKGTGHVPSRNDGEAIALMHFELSKALEALIDKNYGLLAEALADCCIKIFDFCGGNNIDLETAIMHKIEKNKK